MSGGSYDYAYSRLDDLADQIRAKGSCHCAPPHVRLAFANLLRMCAVAAKAIEWNDSGDGANDEESLIRACLARTAPLDAAAEAAREAYRQLHSEISRAEREATPQAFVPVDSAVAGLALSPFTPTEAGRLVSAVRVLMQYMSISWTDDTQPAVRISEGQAFTYALAAVRMRLCELDATIAPK